MSTAIMPKPSTGTLDAFCVASPVSGTHMLRWAWDVGFLLGQNTQQIVSQRYVLSATTSRTTWISYTRNPGVSVLMIEAEAHKGTALGANGTVTVTSSAGTIAWVAAGQSYGFSGTASAFTAHSTDNIHRRKHRAFLNVTGLTVGTTYDLKFAFVNVANCNGIAKLTIFEVPIGTTDPARAPTEEIGLEGDSYRSGEAISTETTTSARGMARLRNQIDKCRIGNKRQWQVGTSELDADAFTTTSAPYASMMAAHAARNPTWRFRARRLYTTAANNVYLGAFRYKVTGGGLARIRFLINGVEYNSGDITSASYAECTPFAVNIPCNGATDQEVTIQIEGKTTAGTLYVSRARLLENES